MGIGKALTGLLKEKDTNVHEVASKTGIKPSTLYSIIQRDSMSANVRDLWRLAHYLDVTVDYLYELVERQNREDGVEESQDEYVEAMGVPDVADEGCTTVEDVDLELLRNDVGYYQVADTSMEPNYSPGDIIVVMPGQLPGLGEEGIFIRDGVCLLRQRVQDALVAYNPRVPPIEFPTKQPFDNFGTVVGRVRFTY